MLVSGAVCAPLKWNSGAEGRLSAGAKIGYLPESLATYRLLDESASRSSATPRTIRFELSDSEMKLYLCDKYGLPESVRRNREAEWCRAALELAFYEGNGDLAVEARRLKRILSVKEWLWYGGARSVGIKSLLMAAGRCCKSIHAECDQLTDSADSRCRLRQDGLARSLPSS